MRLEAALRVAAAHPLVRRWLAWPEERRDLVLVGLLGALVFLPWLGAVGLWDPWEPHYAEVAREMIDRRDYVYPYWESAHFFSKPVLTFWMMAPMMLLAGTNAPEAGTGVYTEWLVRLPFAALAILAMALAYVAARRTMNRRVGLIAALAMATSPLYFLMARQAITDMPFVALLVCAMAAWMVGTLEKDEPQPGWLYAAYSFMGLATLAKGLLGFLLPGAVVFAYLAVTGEWALLRRMRLVQGAVIVLAVAGPWYGAMIGFDGVDDEGKTFFQRFFIHDHFNRLAKGVHTTERMEDTTFVYFVEQLGFAAFPWIALAPGIFACSSPRRAGPGSSADRAARAHLLVLVWGAVSFALFAFASTKYHHYILPVVPPLAILCGHFVDRLLDEGLERFAPAILLSILLFALVARDLWMRPKHLSDLFVYKYDRPYPHGLVNPRVAFSLIYAAGGAVALSALPWLRRMVFWGPTKLLLFFELIDKEPAWLMPKEHPADRRTFAAGLAVVALGFALYTSWYHWRKLTPHWTQRDLVWTYHQERRGEEPLIAYSMNWRGETFYTRNRVRQIMQDPDRLRQAVAVPGREWVLCEQGRFEDMKRQLGPAYKVKKVDSSSNKFFLATID